VEYEQLIIGAARIVEASGVSVLIFGAVIAAASFAWRIAHGHDFREAYHGLRVNLGRAILLGLELLVIADIIGTVAITPSFQNLGILATIVAIRTLLSFTLELEVSGRWPWQREERETGPDDR
jgi:uncharacterized membrane protein